MFLAFRNFPFFVVSNLGSSKRTLEIEKLGNHKITLRGARTAVDYYPSGNNKKFVLKPDQPSHHTPTLRDTTIVV